MNPRKNRRFFWQAGSFSLLVMVMLSSGYVALEQARALREKASELQTRIAPLVFGFNDLEANFSALHTGNAVLRTQLEHMPSIDRALLNVPESVTAAVYIGRINEDLQHMAHLAIGIKTRAEFFGLRNALSRYGQRHAEYRALVAAGRFDKAISYYDNVLLASSTDISKQISILIERYRLLVELHLRGVDQAVANTFWTIAVSLGLAIAACLLIAAWHLRASWHLSHRAALFDGVGTEGGTQSDVSVQMLVETAREMHSLASFPVNAQPVEAFAAKRD